MVDGVSNDQIVTAGNRGGFSLEAVREFAVMTNQFSAEYGLSSGAVFSVITRSGTNELKGRVFAFHRGDELDAQNPFSKAQGSGQAPFSQQRFGGFLGGPIVRDKLQYFASYEGTRQRETSVITSALVPLDQRETPHPQDGHNMFVKTDQRLTDRQSLSVRYRADKSKLDRRRHRRQQRPCHSRARHQQQRAGAGRGRQPHDGGLVSRALNEFRVQWGRQSTWNNTDGWSTAGMPEINRPSMLTGKAYNQPQGRDENRWQFINNFTYTMSSHDLKFGADVSFIRAPTFFPRNGDGTYTFTTDAAVRCEQPGDLSRRSSRSRSPIPGSIWTTTSTRSSCRTPGGCEPT